MGEVPCIDTACPGAVLASRRRGATGKVVEVGVGAAGVVGVGARQDHALGEWLWGHGHDEATRLMEDKRSEPNVRANMGAPHTKNCSCLRRPL
jgi:hypothetical protein